MNNFAFYDFMENSACAKNKTMSLFRIVIYVDIVC